MIESGLNAENSHLPDRSTKRAGQGNLADSATNNPHDGRGDSGDYFDGRLYWRLGFSLYQFVWTVD